jgi:hypothetical protein
MRFSDIQKDPRNYDTDILVGKLENYFTATFENCPFVDLLSETVIHLTLTDETIEPVTIPIYVKHDKGQTTAHVPQQHVVGLYNGTRWNEAPAFTTDFLQAVMCETVDNKQFQNQVRDAIASKVLETMTERTALELEQLFGGYFEEHLDDINFTIQLNFRYRFLRTNRIEVTTRTDESFQLVKSETTNTWKVNKEISEQLFDKLKEDFKRIKNLIDQQPKQYECVLNQTLPEELVPYLRNIQHIHVVLTGGRTEPVWLTDHKKVVVDYWGDFDMRKRYQLELEVPVILSYRYDTVVATFPVTPGQSLKPVEKAMEYLQNRFQYRTSIKGRLTQYHVKDLLTRAIAAQHDVICRVIFGLEEGATCFTEQGVEYELRVSDDRVYYERDRHIQWVFVKDGNDFSIDLEYSDLFNVNPSELKETIKELVDKF